ncbi:MAG TPA: thiamine pyrophosphate-requiring protein [Myxococcaceae bacterium]|nr:thiamine pyrophosphate-requiring protein [Myxococcaceae bacterium]
MPASVSSYLLRRLTEWGVRRVFGYSGDGINGVVHAFSHLEDRLKFVQVRHEEMAAFMACAHAKFTGEVGVCLATSGPGAIHLLNGLYDAKMDHQPVVAIVGQAARPARGGAYQQEVDLHTLFKDVAHEFVEEMASAAQVRQLVDRAMRIARAERTVTAIIVPKDLQEEKVEQPPHRHDTVHTGLGWSSPRVVPAESDLRRAAEVLNAGRKVAMLVGAGALGATPEVARTAEVLGAGVAKALLGKAVLDDRLPYVTGSIGLLGTKPSWVLMNDCDTLLMVGSSFPYSEFLPEEGKARGVQIDIDGRMLGLRYPMEVNLVGDSAETLRALLPRLEQKTDLAWQKKIEQEIQQWWRIVESRAMVDAHPLNPERVYWEMSPRLPDGAILAGDSGSSTNWLARDVRIRQGMLCTVSGNLATMGCGVPYAIGAKFAYPERVVVACVGDGAMQMNGNAELITISKYWKEWADPRLVVLVLNNRDLNQVTWEMRAMSGDPKLEASQDLPDFPFARYAELLGLQGIKVERPDELGPAFDRAFAASRPTVVEAYTDPNVATFPPHITFDEARNFTYAMLKGDPDSGGVVRQTLHEAWATLKPGKRD